MSPADGNGGIAPLGVAALQNRTAARRHIHSWKPKVWKGGAGAWGPLLDRWPDATHRSPYLLNLLHILLYITNRSRSSVSIFYISHRVRELGHGLFRYMGKVIADLLGKVITEAVSFFTNRIPVLDFPTSAVSAF